MIKFCGYKTIAESSNGRTTDSGSVYWGSNPCSAALTGTPTVIPTMA